MASALLQRLWTAETGVLSVQVLQEFLVTITRKVARPLSLDVAEERVRELTAWDALIVHAAAESGCGVCWTEALQDGQVVRGVRMRNPFLHS